MRIAPMTGPARDRVFSFEVVLIDGANHAKHFSRCLLGGLVLAVPFIRDVTVCTADAE